MERAEESWSETPRDFHVTRSSAKKLSFPFPSWTAERAAAPYALVLPVRDLRVLEQKRETINGEGDDVVVVV